jgi:hypothetical protein
MENGPQSFRPDALTHLEQETIKLENHLLLGRTKKRTKRQLRRSILQDVGATSIDRKTRLLAVGYSCDADGYMRPDPITVDTEEARLRGVKIKTLNGEERVLLHYDVYDPANVDTVDRYFVPPLAVLESVIDETRNHPLFEAIEKTKYLAQRMFIEQDFFRQSAEQQAELLKKHVSEEFIAEATVNYTEDVMLQVGCDWYYLLPLPTAVSDDWTQYVHKGAVLEGHMINAVYPEWLQTSPKPITDKSVFSDGQGLPYLVLKSEMIDGVALIPLAGVQSFASDVDNYA